MRSTPTLPARPSPPSWPTGWRPYDATGVLSGSRATGRHHDGSDIDLMVCYDSENDDAPPKDEEPFPKLRRATGSFLLGQQQKRPRSDVDVNIVEQSGKEFYFHHRQNLQQPQPNGFLFASSGNAPGREQNFGRQTRSHQPDRDAYPVHFTSTELWGVKVLYDSPGSFGKLDTVLRADLPATDGICRRLTNHNSQRVANTGNSTPR